MNLYGPALPTPLTPENVIFAFDLHEVVFYRCWASIKSYVAKSPHKAVLMRFVLSPLFWWRFYKIICSTAVGDEVFERLLALYPTLAPFKKEFIEIENMQKLDEQMSQLLLDLKRKKFKLCVLSNIGLDAYTQLALKFPFLAIFDEIFVPSRATGYCQKPSCEFYMNFKKYLDARGYKQSHIVFIDDKPENIHAAAKCAISGIIFKTPILFKEAIKTLLIF